MLTPPDLENIPNGLPLTEKWLQCSQSRKKLPTRNRLLNSRYLSANWGMSPLLDNIFNLSVQYGTFLSHHKSSVQPLYMRRTRLDQANYRLISYTLIISRITTRLVQMWLLMYLTDTKVVNTGQHDFLQRKSCAACMADCPKTIAIVANAGKLVMA